MMMAGDSGGESFAAFDGSEYGDYEYNGIDLVLPGEAHPHAVEILRAMGYGVSIHLTAMSARVVPEPRAGVVLMAAAMVVGRRSRMVG